MKMTLLALGLFDILAAALIFYPMTETILLYVMVIMLAKGGFFLLSGVASGSMSPHCMGLCISDLLVGLALAAVSLGYGTPTTVGMIGTAIKVAGTIGIVKGLYTTVMPAMG
jgi:hypothetical protein